MQDIPFYAISIASIVMTGLISLRDELYFAVLALRNKYTLWQYRQLFDREVNQPPTRDDKVKTLTQIKRLAQIVKDIDEGRRDPDVILAPNWLGRDLDDFHRRAHTRLEASIRVARKVGCYPNEEGAKNLIPELNYFSVIPDNVDILL